MKIKHGFYASVAALTLSCAGFLSSCEDKCASCNCDAFHVDYVVSPDSSDVHLTELSSKTTVVLVGSGLGAANGVYLVDKNGNPYPVELNPAFVTDNSIVITLNSDANELRTESLLVTSTGGCQSSIALAKPVPAPSIKMFRSEFVADDDTLRVAGNAFLSVNGDKLEVYFVDYDKPENKVKADYVVQHDNCELLVKVPKGLGDNKRLLVKNQFGEGQSPMLFRDRRNVFLDFDKTMASGDHGALDYSSNEWNDYIAKEISDNDREKHQLIRDAIKGYPEGCDGYYAAITSTGDNYGFKQDEMIYLTQMQSGAATKADAYDLRGQFIDTAIDKLVLKFEVYISKAAPLGSWFYIVFGGYGSEDHKMAKQLYGKLLPVDEKYHYLRDITNVYGFNEEDGSCSDNKVGVPAAWLNMATLDVNDGESPSGKLGTPFHTNDTWMTVAVPLTRDYFHYNVSSWNLITSEKLVSCGILKDYDFYNFLIHCEAGGFQTDQAATKFAAGKLFVAFDNFRIVPEDNGGTRFTKYYGPTAGSKYPF